MPASPYLVLLRAGFCLPPVLPRARCALTAPFHPYSSLAPAFRPALAQSGIFSVPLIRQVALPGRYPAHRPAEFGLSSPSSTSRLPAVTGGGRGPPMWCCPVWGLAGHRCSQGRGALLPHLFTLTRRRSRGERRRAVCFLCHWSVRSPCPGVTRLTALWSSDFPPTFARFRAPAGGRLAEFCFPLGPSASEDNDHSSRPAIARGLRRPTR
jgi:hypothetical protein